jgi:hypothetical protein
MLCRKVDSLETQSLRLISDLLSDIATKIALATDSQAKLIAVKEYISKLE